MRYFLLIFSLSSLGILSAQNKNQEMDSLYNKIIEFKNINQNGNLIEESYHKCRFGLMASAVENFNSFSGEQQLRIKKILQRPSLQKSIVTPNGFFRIHYDSTGTNMPNYDNLGLQTSLTLLAQALDSSYNFEINILGYAPPPGDNGSGGDNLYDIYIISSIGNSFGYTEPEDLVSSQNNTYTSFMVIHNTFKDFPTTGINAARVTVAHEFFHAVQIGDYTLRYDLDGYFYELSSTAMEEFVYNTVNDYYNYLPFYFNNAANAFACASCSQGQQQYALAVWNIFMKDRFGFDIIKKQWELMPRMRALQAINLSLQENGSSFRSEFARFGTWLFFTGSRTEYGKYFEEAVNYPLLKPVTSILFNSPAKSVGINAYPTSLNFIRFINPQNYDTLSVLISNSDVVKGIDSLNSSNNPFEFNLYNSFANGRIKLNDFYYSQLLASNKNFWSETDILNNVILKEDSSVISPESILDYAYPNPFFYNKNYLDSKIRIPVKSNIASKVDINIYTVSMDLVYSSNLTVEIGEQGNTVIKWEPKDNNGNKLSSGVYIYYTKNGDETTTGKIVIFNE